MTPGNTKKGYMTHWLVSLDTGPGLTFVSQLDSGLDLSERKVYIIRDGSSALGYLLNAGICQLKIAILMKCTRL